MLKHLQSREDWSEKSLGAKGFTLVELLVVIVILGILAAVVVFAVSGINQEAQDGACAAEARTVRAAQEAYAARNDGDYAVNGSGLSPDYLSKPTTLIADTSTLTTLNLAWAGDCVGQSGTP